MVEGRHFTLSPRLRQLAKPRGHRKRTLSKNQIKENVNELISLDLLGIAKTLKKSSICSLRLCQSYGELQKRIAENRNLGFLGYRHSETLFSFSKSLAWSLTTGGWLQELELGFALWERDLKILADSIGQSTTLKRLSFSNSELRDHGLRILGKGLQECAQLEILNLSACGLTDSVSHLISAIIKANISRRSQADWQGSLRNFKGINGLMIKPKGLIALDLSLNHLSDISIQTICTVLRMGTPLEALNLRGNQVTRMSGKLLLDVMEEWPVLRLVDLRDNVDNRLMGVLEDKQHFTTFTQRYPPFWMVSTSRPRKTQFKASLRKSKTLEDSLGRVSMHPQSTSNSHQNHVELKKLSRNPAPVIRESCPDYESYVKETKHMKRPSTCPVNNRHHLSSSSSPPLSSSPNEFAAWDDDSNSKENRLPFQIHGPNNQRSDSDIVDRRVPEEKLVMRRKTHKNSTCYQEEESTRFDENFGPTFWQKGPKVRPKNRKHHELGSSRNYDENGSVYEKYQQKYAHKSRMGHLPSKSSRVRSQTTSFLKEISQAIMQLQERLDDLIGHAGPDEPASRYQEQ